MTNKIEKQNPMKKSVLLATGLLASLLTAQAQYFTPGNLAVVRLSGQGADGTGTGLGASVFIDQYTTTGTLVSSYAVPNSGAQALILNGEAYEGLLNITPDNAHLVFAGYNTTLPYASNLIASESVLVPRVVGTLDAYGNFNLVVTNSTNFNDSAISAAASDGTNYWLAGTGPSPSSSIPLGLNEVAYVGTATAGATSQVPPNNLFTTSLRGLTLAEVGGSYQLYAIGEASNSAVNPRTGSFLLSNLSGSLPTSTTGATNLFPGHFPFDLVINPAGTIAYAADNDDGVIRYSFNGTAWVSNYTVSLTNAQGQTTSAFSESATAVTADWTQSPPVVYATTGETFTNRVVRFQDTNATGVDVVTTLALGTIVSGSSGATNTYRGIRFVPQEKFPDIYVPPVAFAGAPGATATFSATALGNPAPTLQWYSNSPANPTYVAIPNATNSTLTISGITSAQSGSLFTLVAVNIYGTASNTPVALTILNPGITAEPVGVTNFPGVGPANLCVTAVGSGTLTYQWLSNGVSLGAAAQSSCYSAPISGVSNTSSYTVIVSNGVGNSITSSPAIVSFTPYLVYDTFTYPNGNIVGGGSPWTEESGSNPIDVTNDRVQISQTIGALGTAFVQDLYTQPQAEGSTVLWSSFIINVTNLPTSTGGSYFGYFQSTNFNFYGRLFVLTSNAPGLTPDIPSAAYPGTYRIGIANDASTASAVVELDMAPGIDYQVVEYYDMVNQFCQVAVNPSQSEYSTVYSPSVDVASPLVSLVTSDSFTPTNLPMAAYGLRQASGAGIFRLDNLQVSYDWNNPGSGFAAVTSSANPVKPVIGFLSPGITNYSGNSNIIEVAASGIDLTYQWYQGTTPLNDGNSILGSATPVLTINPETGTNSGNYTVVVSDAAGSVTSAVVAVSINTTPTAPVFTLQPVSTTASLGANVTFTASAVGTGPITYAWNTGGSPNGSTGSSFTLTRITTNLSGTTYSVTATGGTGLTATSTNAVLTVLGPIVTNIAFLRSLQITNAAPTITIAASNSTPVYQVTATVMTYTNIESATYAEYWIQDSTGGVEFFVIDPSFRPHLGDLVTVSGVVDIFDDAVELDGSANNPQEPYGITSTNGEGLPLPYPNELIPFGFSTANPGLSSLVYQGRRGTFTNVYFATPGAVFADSDTLTVSNLAGQTYAIYTGQSDGPDIIGQTVPKFAYSVTGAYDQFDTEYELNVTSGSDIVTAPPPPVTNLTAALSGVGGTNISLAWTAIPGIYTYSVWSSTNVAGPYAPLAGGLWFTNASAGYTNVGPTNTAMFYEIVSP
jgi:hypothetical protein